MLLGRRSAESWHFFLVSFVLVLDFAADQVQDLGLSAEEEGMTEDVLAGVFAAFVEAVHVELADEGVDVAVAEVLGQDVVLEVIDLLDGELASVAHPVDYPFVLLVLEDLETLLNEISH